MCETSHAGQRVRRRRSLATRVAVLTSTLLLGLVLVGSASAFKVNEHFFEELTPTEQEAATDFFYEQSPQGTVPYGGEAEELSESMSETYEGETDAEPGYEELVGDVDEIGQDGGTYPEIETAVAAIPAAGQAFATGWLIGEGVNAMFGRVGLLFGSAPEEHLLGAEGYDFCYSAECGGGLEWKAHGEDIYAEATVQQKPGAYLYDGTLFEYGSIWGRWHPVRWFGEPCTFSDFSPPPYSSLEEGVTSGTMCGLSFGETASLYVDYPYVTAKKLLSLERFHHYDALLDGSPGVTTKAPENPGTAVVEEKAAESIDESGFLQAYLGWKFFKESEPEDDPAKIGIPPKVRSKEDVCTPVGTSGTYDPGYEAKATLVTTFAGIENPFNASAETVHLFWGDEEWGYRHIQMFHGWSPEDEVATEEALVEPDAITPDKNSATSKDYYKYYLGQDGKTKCKRFVVVQWSAAEHPTFPTEAEPLPYGIITSMGIPSNEGDPEVGIGL